VERRIGREGRLSIPADWLSPSVLAERNGDAVIDLNELRRIMRATG
jgi:hypothetical protein